MLRLNVLLASLLAALGADAAPRAVALVEMGDERPHVREYRPPNYVAAALQARQADCGSRSEARYNVRVQPESEILAAAREQRCLFARKFDAKCDLRCLAKSGFRGFQCEGGASPDADVAVTRKQWPR